jgi:PAS domain S-box-containing protein
MWLTGLDRKRRFVNQAYLDMIRLPYEEALAFDWRTILHPDDHDRIVAESIAGEAALKSFALEARYRIGDGSWHWLHSVSQPLLDDDGEHMGFIGVAFDLTEAKEAEWHLRETEERLRLATAGSGTGIWEWDLATKRGTWSEETRRIIGVAADEVITVDEYTALIHPDDIGMVLAETNAALKADREFALEYRTVRPDGEIRWVLAKGVGIRSPNRRMARSIGTLVDITDRKAADEQLREAEERLRLATESAGIGTWDWDLVRLRGAWSDKTREILGAEREGEITPEVRYASIHPADRERVMHEVRRSIADGSEFEMEYRAVRPDGDIRWVSSRGIMLRGSEGQVVRTIGTVRDITVRRRTQERLEELNRTLESVVADRTRERDAMWRLSRDLLLVLDPRLRIVAINPIVAELTGYSPDDVIGKRFLAFLHPEDRSVLTAAIHRGRRERVSDVEARLVTRDGEVRSFVWNASPEAGRAFVSGRDVTDERARLDELLTAQEALRQSQKLEAIGQLTGGVAHDFNNLLSPIIGGLDILKRRGVGGEREQRLIDGALQSADRAKVLVQRLLAFARRQPLQVAPVQLGPLLRDLQGLLGSTLGPHIELVIDVSSELAPVVADLNQLEMAIINLAVNARDAMPSGGTLRISARHTASEEQEWIELAVADDGTGMDAATLARATEPFFSSKGIGKGTGLGLSMVEGLTAQLGGAMHIASEPGSGTTVTLCLPAAASAPTPDAKTESCPAGERRGRVLIVDDEALVRLSTADALSDEGFAVSEADSAEQALSLLEAGSGFDCIVTDYLMPGMNGVELAKLVGERFPRMPIVLLSGYAELDAFGSDLPYLAKPCPTATLVRTISGLLEPIEAA